MKQYTVGWFVELAYMPNKHILQLLFLAIVHSGEISKKIEEPSAQRIALAVQARSC